MVPKDSLSWYEANLPARERKVRGHFSTPPLLVEQILDACGYCAEHDLSHLRILDPACGSGNFLAGVAHRLIASGRRRHLGQASLLAAVQRNIWGFDPDPVACFLAEMQLRAVLAEEIVHRGGVRKLLSKETSSRATKNECLPLHIHQADGLAFPWGQSESVDLFLANPPYLASKNSDLSGYSFAQRRGQADSYLLFLNLALQVVRPGGWIGLVLPDPVLARTNAAKERQRLLEGTTVHHLWHLSGVFSAYVGAVVIIAQKHPPSHLHQISWVRKKWIRDGGAQSIVPTSGSEDLQILATAAPRAHFIAQAALLRQPGSELRYLLSEVRGTLIERLHTSLSSPTAPHASRHFIRLGDLVSIRRGEELGKESPLLAETRPVDGQDWYPVLRGGVDVRPYERPMGQRWIAHNHVSKSLDRYLAPKLLVVKSTGSLQATLDLQGHVVLQTLYLLNLWTSGSEDDLYFLLALLNSRLLREYMYTLHTAYKWVQPQIEQHVLVHLPVPTIDIAEKKQIIEQAKLLNQACSEQPFVVEFERQHKEMLQKQERAICQLYATALQERTVED